MSAPIPPPPPTGSGSCWKWGGIACLGIGCVGVVVIGILTAIVFSRPEFKKVWRTTQEAGQAVQRMQQVGKAIDKYTHDKGKYPNALTDLAPAYISADQLSPSNDPEAEQFVYHRPPADAPDDFVMLIYDMKNPIAPNQAPAIRYFITRKGKLGTLNAVSDPEPDRRAPGATAEESKTSGTR